MSTTAVNQATPNSTGLNPWRVAVSGLSSVGLYLLERLSVAEEIQLVGAYDADPQRRRMAEGLGCPVFERPVSETLVTDCDVVFLADRFSVADVTTAIGGGRQVAIHQPWSLSAAELETLNRSATASEGRIAIVSFRRWSAEFIAATTAKQTGRLGRLKTVNFVSYEKRVPDEAVSTGILREFGFPLLDQLLVLTESRPTRVYGKLVETAASASGFVGRIDFDSGCTAEINVNTKSRLGFRTGWLLEGETGSYRSDRLYTETNDGEIVDEPILRWTLPADPLIGELIAAWRGESTSLATLADAANVMRLIEAIERSAETGEIVRL